MNYQESCIPNPTAFYLRGLEQTKLWKISLNKVNGLNLLTLKMTAAKAVETSVTSTNSLSEDYTNLDDQFPQT